MKTTLLGLRGAGKSTLFSALVRQPLPEVAAPTHERRIAVVELPDPRIDRLAAIFQPRKVTGPAITVVDSAPPLPPETAILPSPTLADVRTSDAVTLVVAAFAAPTVPRDRLDPAGDYRRLVDELVLADLALVEGRLERLEKQARGRPKEGATTGAAERSVLERLRQHLEAGQPLRTLILSPREAEAIRHLEFVSRQPQVVVVNLPEEALDTGEPEAVAAVRAVAEDVPVLGICARLEAEVAQWSPEEEAAFLREIGVEESGRVRLGRAILAAADRIVFYTGGPVEVRAWLLPRGATALEAAGRIHSDFARGFIRAEVVAADALIAAGSERAAREQGLVHVETKSYVVQEGDVITVRFSV